jgi:hypothetical protein
MIATLTIEVTSDYGLYTNTESADKAKQSGVVGQFELGWREEIKTHAGCGSWQFHSAEYATTSFLVPLYPLEIRVER